MVCVGLDESECNAQDASATLPGLRIKNGIQVGRFMGVIVPKPCLTRK